MPGARRVIANLRQAVRRHAGAFVIDSGFRAMARLGKLHPDARPERHHVEIVRDVAYLHSGLPEHRLDVYRPTRRQAPFPVVLYVHGGGFRILSKDTHWIMGLAFARRGYLVFNISYRLAPKHRFPAAIDDACAALLWVLKHAARYGGDTSRLVFAGESAGANLAASLAVATSYRRPEPWARAVYDAGVAPGAVVPACGIFQVSDPDRFLRNGKLSPFLHDRIDEVSRAYLGKVSAGRPGGLDLADPVVLLERGDRPDRPLPPFHSFVGTKDPLLDDTRRLHAALEALGARSSVAYYPGEVHAFHAMVWRPRARQAWVDTFRFLDEHVPV